LPDIHRRARARVAIRGRQLPRSALGAPSIRAVVVSATIRRAHDAFDDVATT
jgi:hypothetical protein